MAYSYTEIVGNGSIQQVAVPPYISKEHIVVTIDGATTTDFEWTSDSTIAVVGPHLAEVRVSRHSSPGARLVDYMDGVPLTELALDNDSIQAFYLMQEAIDRANEGFTGNGLGDISANGSRLVDLGDPVNPQDAITKLWAETAMSSQLAIGGTQLAEIQLLHSQLHSLTTSMSRLPYGSEGYVQYNATTGMLRFFLSEGPQGVQGGTGPQGPLGPQGPAGVEGPRGPQGVMGFTGNTGPTGPTGTQGITGLQGAKGDQGIAGVQGPQGNTGATGVQGPQGIQGTTGALGPVGPLGPQGIQGTTGLTGLQGPLGPVGPIGPQGVLGPTGVQGPVGPLGPQGPLGNMGATPLGLAFGHFYLNAEGELMIEYYGDAQDNDFRIDVDGYLYVTTV